MDGNDEIGLINGERGRAQAPRLGLAGRGLPVGGRVRNAVRPTTEVCRGFDALMFNERHDYELDGFSDEELIAYVVEAREAGNLDAARLGLSIFAWRRFDNLMLKALAKLPSQQDAEDVAMQAIEGVFKGAFRGQAVGEAVVFMRTILERRIADFWRRRKETEPLPEEVDDEERKRRDVAITESESGAVDAQDAIDRVRGALSPPHRKVIDDYVTEGYDAEETAERVNEAFPDLDPPMSAQNVHKIASRYRKDLRRELEAD